MNKNKQHIELVYLQQIR